VDEPRGSPWASPEPGERLSWCGRCRAGLDATVRRDSRFEPLYTQPCRLGRQTTIQSGPLVPGERRQSLLDDGLGAGFSDGVASWALARGRDGKRSVGGRSLAVAPYLVRAISAETIG